MTAPLFNLPIANPLAGAATAAAGQEPVTGFEALLATFFAESASPVPEAVGGDGTAPEKDPGEQPVAADGQAAHVPSPEAQALAAMLAAPTAASVVPPPAEDATTPREDAQGATGRSPSPASALPFPTPGAATAPAPVPNTPGKAARQSDVAAVQPEPPIPVAAAATDPDVALPAAARAAPDGKNPIPSTAKPSEPIASGPNSVAPPPTTSAPPAAAQPPTPPAPAPVAPSVVAQAEALVGDAPPAPPPEAAPRAPARNAKSADGTARGAMQPAGPASTGEPVLPTAVAPPSNTNPTNVPVSGDAASALEADVTPSPRPAESDAAPDAPAALANAAPAAPAVAAAHTPAVRATPETVAHLTAQISHKLEGHSTKFDVELNPAGLGRVSVSVEIAASGKMTAAMSFDSPQAAAELRARSHEIQRALEQAGFDLSGGLSFDVAGDRGDGRGDGRGAPQQQAQNDGAAWRGRAFQAVLGTAGDAVEAASSLALNHGRRPTTGVDVRI